MLSEEYRKRRKEYEEKAKEIPGLNINSVKQGSKYTTVSGSDVNVFYGPDDLENINYLRDIGFPGEYPYTRGIHSNGYRGKVWTMRQFAGFGSPEDTNKRFHYLLDHGQTGLSVAFDLPTLMGWDADAPLSEGEVGICGVSISSLKDMETLFHNIPLEKVKVTTHIEETGISVVSEVSCTGKTGVEMEALTAVSVALLTVYDMCKSAERGMVIEAIRLEEKAKKDLK